MQSELTTLFIEARVIWLESVQSVGFDNEVSESMARCLFVYFCRLGDYRISGIAMSIAFPSMNSTHIEAGQHCHWHIASRKFREADIGQEAVDGYLIDTA